ncbi:MAG: hypothetical protein KTR20_07595 [Cellvibrionaceae bacterium]|nr:hypothetical protein [Cellvibrionaceae bacterium]
MLKKSNTLGLARTRLEDFPPSLKSDFVNDIRDGYRPSLVLRKIMQKYKLNDMHPFLVVNLFDLAYPSMLLLHLGAWLYENHYPTSTALANDNDFDEMIQALLIKSYQC